MTNINIDGYKLQINKHNSKDMYIGIFKNDTSLPTIFGDSEKEILDQAEDIIFKKSNCK